MMMGLDVAPVAPSLRLRAISSGSTESSQSLVPAFTSDCSGVMVYLRDVQQWYADDADETTVADPRQIQTKILVF